MKRSNDEIKALYERWMDALPADSELRAELAQYDEETIRERFITDLSFGTAGLRGVMAAGSNAMNLYTVMQATQGFAEYIRIQGGAERGVVIAYDSRINSRLFAESTASVFAANGIKTYLFDALRPTPELSFALRHLKCMAGVNITASHNPKQYNGYKAYWEDGAQLGPDQANAVAACIGRCDIFSGVRSCDFRQACADGRIVMLGRSTDEVYIRAVMKERVNPQMTINEYFRVVYTPLHGAGRTLVPEVLRRCGIRHLYTVAEQMVPDGTFPTTPRPNPEYPEVFEKAIELADRVESDLIIANDPDCDRTGVMTRGRDGRFVALSGNQVGCLLLDYILTVLKNKGELPARPYAVKTIVTSELVTRICAKAGVKLYNVLTGFKYIGEVIKEHENDSESVMLLGFEESYGYLKGSYARDKDGVLAAMLIAEMAAFYRTRRMSLLDAMQSLYKRYGWFCEKTDEIYMEGLDGLERMKALMDRLRNCPPADIAGRPIRYVRDYQKGTIVNVKSGVSVPTNLPRSNVLYFETVDQNVVVIRPSGTEPKIKVYFLTHDDTEEASRQTLDAFRAAASAWLR